MLRRIAQRLAQSAHRVIQAVFEIAEGTPGPEGLVQLLARYNITSALDEHHQDLQGLFLEVDLSVIGPQFSRLSIELEVCKTNRAW
jgi:hypothetical protein